MRNEARWVIAILLLFAGGIAFSLLTRRATVIQADPGDLWVGRQFDLFLQAGLFFLGALGIRALLPGEGEE